MTPRGSVGCNDGGQGRHGGARRKADSHPAVVGDHPDLSNLENAFTGGVCPPSHSGA